MSTHTIATNLSGRSLIGEQSAQRRGSVFYAVNPATGEKLEPAFYSATSDDIDQAATLATDAFDHLATLSGQDRARLLRGIAESLLSEARAIVERANLETGLPLPRHVGSSPTPRPARPPSRSLPPTPTHSTASTSTAMATARW